jgi:hypothetical protein
MGRRGHPPEFRRKVLDLVEAGRPIAEVAEALGSAPSRSTPGAVRTASTEPAAGPKQPRAPRADHGAASDRAAGDRPHAEVGVRQPRRPSMLHVEQARSRSTISGLTRRWLRYGPQGPDHIHPDSCVPARWRRGILGRCLSRRWAGLVAADRLASLGREHLGLSREVLSGRWTPPPAADLDQRRDKQVYESPAQSRYGGRGRS